MWYRPLNDVRIWGSPGSANPDRCRPEAQGRDRQVPKARAFAEPVRHRPATDTAKPGREAGRRSAGSTLPLFDASGSSKEEFAQGKTQSPENGHREVPAGWQRQGRRPWRWSFARGIRHRQAPRRVRVPTGLVSPVGALPNRDVSRLGAQTPLDAATPSRLGLCDCPVNLPRLCWARVRALVEWSPAVR